MPSEFPAPQKYRDFIDSGLRSGSNAIGGAGHPVLARVTPLGEFVELMIDVKGAEFVQPPPQYTERLVPGVAHLLVTLGVSMTSRNASIPEDVHHPDGPGTRNTIVETAIRALRNFQRDGIVHGSVGHIEIRDASKLKCIAERQPDST